MHYDTCGLAVNLCAFHGWPYLVNVYIKMENILFAIPCVSEPLSSIFTCLSLKEDSQLIY